jgi:iron complex transport system permease protein
MTGRFHLAPIVAWSVLAALATWLCYRQIEIRLSDNGAGALLNHVIMFESLLPRAAVSIASGAALGLSGALLQQVLRNPIADPSTLGISAGAQLALTATTLFAPSLMETSPEIAALAGGAGAVALVLALTWKRGLDPVTVVLAGMVMSLIALSLSATLILANGEYMMSLFIWGSGSLSQQGWGPSQGIAIRFIIGIALAMVMLRPLQILGLDDTSARSLGISLAAMRLLVLGVAVWLASSVVAEVGVIGFIGLAAPALARISGARTQLHILTVAPLIGAILLFATDGLVQVTAAGGPEIVPTGAATALLGGPLLLFLLPRLRRVRRPVLTDSPAVHRNRNAVPVLTGASLLLVFLILLSLTVGRGPNGWSFAWGALMSDLLPFRAPGMIAAASAGAMLAAAGTIVQRLTGNPLSSPEVLGISAGAGVGLAAVLLLVAVPTDTDRLMGATVGVAAVLASLLLLIARRQNTPDALLLGGIAVGAFCSALVNAAMAQGDRRSFELLAWISGSTSTVDWNDALVSLFLAIVLLAVLPVTARWLRIWPLGSATAQAVGVPLNGSRLLLVFLAGILTAASSLIVGPLSFVGLVAPHMARLWGFAAPLQALTASVLTGATLMVGADWLARVLTFPYQLPLGLLASLMGGPYLIWLLRKDT